MILSAGEPVPLETGAWTELQYDGIPPNQIRFAGGDIHIAIEASAGSLARVFEHPVRGGALKVRARIQGGLQLDEDQRQGEAGAEDCVLRIGLVLDGERRMGPVEKVFAPAWLKNLEALLPEGRGVGRVLFTSVASDPDVVGERRAHPMSGRIEEYFHSLCPKDGRVNLEIVLPREKTVIGLWIASDGDDTGSFFQVTLKELLLKPEKPLD